jgi:drug/metabolite transporter (DMT)-like permease
MINRSLLSFSPEQVVGYRLLIASIVLVFIALLRGKSLPGTLLPWLHFIIFAVIGNILPFLLIAKGQLTISSGMAGLLMAIMPLVTLILAHFFLPNDKLNRYKIIGFVLGISGVFFILGPSLNDNNNTVFGILLVLAAACCYAINTIFATRLPSYDPLVSSSGVLIVASVISFLIWPDIFYLNFLELSLISILSILLLGIFPTAIAMVIYFNIINSAGATFLSNINYLIPVVAFFLGALVLGESIFWHNLLALLLIISGIVISRLRI